MKKPEIITVIIAIIAVVLLTALILARPVYLALNPEETTGSADESTEETFAEETTGAEVTTEAPEITTEPVTEPITEPITEPVTEPITEPVTEPVTEPLTEPITEPLTEPISEPETTAAEAWRLLYTPKHIEGSESVGITSSGYAIEVKDGITYVGGILIANKTYTLPDTYRPEYYNGEDWVAKLLPEAQTAFEKMQADFKAENPRASGFKIQSAYRSYTYQGGLYNNYVKRDGKAAADRYSARAGHSEHQTGLGADINPVGTSTLTEAIKNTTEGKWLAENSWKYGFILRYPEGKEEITGYLFEPWHFRYVGIEAAAAIHMSGLTLEEFLGITSVYAD